MCVASGVEPESSFSRPGRFWAPHVAHIVEGFLWILKVSPVLNGALPRSLAYDPSWNVFSSWSITSMVYIS
jgi:hypothetical protein